MRRVSDASEDGPRDLWHVGMVVSDIESAIVFYTEGLGLRVRHRQTQENPYTSGLVGYDDARLHVAQLSLPGGQTTRSGHLVELVQYERPPGLPGEPENRRLGTCHVAFQVDDIVATRARLEARGATFHGPTQDITAGINRGGRAVYLRDPDGNNLELLQPPPRPSDSDHAPPNTEDLHR
jgi:catechol 2,3-dioxygenase-like lactoylglutathione lyase family enzyme